MRINIDAFQKPIKLLQITDSHLGDQPGESLLGMDTDYSLDLVLQLIRSEREQADLLLATGDISSCGALASYQRFHQLTEDLARHALWLPGNHDTLPVMQEAVGDGGQLWRSVSVDGWQLVMLDSTIPGKAGGAISSSELAFLQQSLEQSVGRHVLICLHHHPITIGCDWLDQQQVANSEAFFEVLDQFDHVRGLLWGHVHQSIDQQRNGVRLLASPSTCIQFEANSPDFQLARLNPGYRWLELYPDGSIKSDISRVTGVTFDIDYEQADGY